MGIRRAKKSGIEHSRKLHVVYESPHSCDQSWIFFALDRLSHPKLCFWLYQLSYGCTQYDNRRLSFAVSPFHCRGKKKIVPALLETEISQLIVSAIFQILHSPEGKAN